MRILKPPPRAKRWGVNGLLFCASSLAALALAEVLVRLAIPQPETAEWFTENTDYGFALKPDFSQDFSYPGHDFVMKVRTNSMGFRDRNFDISDSFAGKVLMVLGDSFAFGYGVNVEDRFDTVLGSLAAASARQLQVVNCGVPGWGTKNETAFGREHLEEFRPDVILLLFCGNDPANDRGEGLPALPDRSSRLYLPKSLLRNHSHLYRYAMKQLALARHSRSIETETEHAESATLDAQSASVISEEDWTRTTELIRKFHADYLEFNRDGRLVLMATAPDSKEIRGHLSALADGERLVFLDMAEAASGLSEEARRMPWDGHWSPEMHALAADALFGFLKERGLLDGDEGQGM